MSNYLDFDLFLREKACTPLQVKVMGKVYPVKPEIPALIPMALARAEAALDGEAGIRLSLQAADAIFGAEAMDEMCRKGLSAADLAELVRQTVDMIRGEDEKDRGEVLMDDAGHLAARKTPGKA